jgi:hypothetical protein
LRRPFPPPHGPTLLDISITHPLFPTYIAAVSQMRGAAAAQRGMSKYQVYASHLFPRHTFVPASVETYGHVGRPFMRYLCTLSNIVSARSLADTRGSFLACAHRKVSVDLMQSHGYVYCSCLLLLAKALRQILPGRQSLSRLSIRLWCLSVGRDRLFPLYFRVVIKP